MMSFVLKYDESFYNVIRQYFVRLIDIDAVPSILKVVTLVGGVIGVTSYAFYRVHAHRCRRITRGTRRYSNVFQDIQNFNRSIIRQQSILSHKDLFRKLQHFADKCYDKAYALKCIDIVVYCPQLLNVKCPTTGITPFHRVCYHGHTCLITFMLGKGADPSIATVTGENALCMAVYYFLNNPLQDDFSCLEMLYETGCRFGAKNKWYTVLLKKAVNINHTKLFQWIILHQKAPLYKISRSYSAPLQ